MTFIAARFCDGRLFLFRLPTVDRRLRSDQAGISAMSSIGVTVSIAGKNMHAWGWPSDNIRAMSRPAK
jgi:hypothetical protein